MSLLVGSRALAVVMDQVYLEYPREACGFLSGIDGAATRAVPMRNVMAGNEFFAFDPEEQLECWRATEELGEQVLVIWHSHPRTDAQPSLSDIISADPDLLHMIISPDPHIGIRVWGIGGGSYEEVEWRIV